MKNRTGRYVCLKMDETGKLDLYRESDTPKQTRLFNTTQEAEAHLKENGINRYNIVKIEADTF